MLSPRFPQGIIRYAHQINKGDMPYIDSPFKKPEIWKDGTDCLFFDSDEATKEQLGFIARVKRYREPKTDGFANASDSNLYEFRVKPICQKLTDST